MTGAFAILASGAGSTAVHLFDAVEAGRIDGRVAVIIGNNSRSGVLEAARSRGVRAMHLSGKTHPDPDDLDAAMLDVLRAESVELVVLAGYMKKLGPRVLDAFAGRILNTHPALLPAYGGQGMYGDHVHAAVLADGATTSGATVHEVTAEYDEGPVVAQRTVPVVPDDDLDSLRARVQAAEKSLLADVVAERLRRVRIFAQDDGMAMHIGPDTAGRLMEVGTITLGDGRTAIAHAMRPARSKYTNPR